MLESVMALKGGGDYQPTRRPRLVDVAKLAGVSLGAASKAISSPGAVRPATRAAVQAAVEVLGYIPSDAGRSLVSRETRMIGVVLPTLDHPVYASFFHALQNRLAEDGYLTVALSHEFDREREVILVERLIRCSVDALILIGSDHKDRTVSMLARAGIPHLFSWSAEGAPAAGAVGFSNVEAMDMIVNHLAGLGHRRIAMINGETHENERARWRLRGVQGAVARHAMELVDVAMVPLTITGGLDGYRMIDPANHRISALICGTDLLAAGALHGANLDGVPVPEGLSITGFDDIEMARLLSPSLTTVKVPVAELGLVTGSAILDMLEHGAAAVPSKLLPVSLVVRQSSGPAPASYARREQMPR